ncbi:hypothetical protein SODALDRAFT_357984 [Sodiomyces alkalinus F11]|uniref:Uncharacterized protein n=1 Tax=Sodiomyces alkalinus (strain CBS 110278 / VKM F-3762 / F11) TaxID=1314773 RepID=A0A3N2PYG6_SODAK|nr:hypothetical protein SODALDRAFT_357984 [Sodiomyces alkalinus F11]ROT39579.1 hypothetical protein SODALDRAFT_357984 [Sodiomyces alkalinus F11]
MSLSDKLGSVLRERPSIFRSFLLGMLWQKAVPQYIDNHQNIQGQQGLDPDIGLRDPNKDAEDPSTPYEIWLPPLHRPHEDTYASRRAQERNDAIIPLPSASWSASPSTCHLPLSPAACPRPDAPFPGKSNPEM